MKSCAVHKCGNDSVRRSDLTYFSVPKRTSIREEWLEIIGAKNSHSHNLFVCELHFRAKDMREGKKELKAHSVPVLRLGKGQIDPIDSDDEFMTYNSDIECEMVDVKESTFRAKNIKIEKELIESRNIKQEPNPEPECETGRRPSRRAAIVAAKKISNTARSYSHKEDPPVASIPLKSIKVEKTQKRKKSPTPPPLPPPEPIEISLDMECDDEILSETQAETLSKAQNHYNLVMKGLRELVQCNVKVIHTDPYGAVLVNQPHLPFQTIPVKKAVIPPSKPRSGMLVFRTEATRIVPAKHSVANSQPSIIII